MTIELPPWPPREFSTFYDHEEDGCRVAMMADTDGRLGVSVRYGDAVRVEMFQRMILSQQGISMLIVRWNNERISLRFRSTDLLPDPTGDAPVAYFDLSSASRMPARGRTLPLVQPERAKNDETRLFLETVVDIDEKLVQGGPYQLLRAAGLIRQLLLDATPLVHRVNREFKLSLRFAILDPDYDPPGEWSFLWLPLDPTPFPGGRVVDVTLDAFLASRILTQNKISATVRDVIKACANAKGGIHLGPADGPAQEAILAFDGQSVMISGQPSLAALAGLCRVVLKGLEPLVNAASR